MCATLGLLRLRQLQAHVVYIIYTYKRNALPIICSSCECRQAEDTSACLQQPATSAVQCQCEASSEERLPEFEKKQKHGLCYSTDVFLPLRWRWGLPPLSGLSNSFQIRVMRQNNSSCTAPEGSLCALVALPFYFNRHVSNRRQQLRLYDGSCCGRAKLPGDYVVICTLQGLARWLVHISIRVMPTDELYLSNQASMICVTRETTA